LKSETVSFALLLAQLHDDRVQFRRVMSRSRFRILDPLDDRTN